MMSGRVITVSVACLGLAGFAAPAHAQGPIRLEALSGVDVPLGAFRRFATYGAMGGVDVGYRATSALTLHVTGSYVRSEGASVPTGALDVALQEPGFRRWNALVGVESRLFSPGAAKDLWITLDVGGGLAHLSSLPFMDPGSTASQTFVHTYPQAQGILRLRYDPRDEPRLAFFVGAGARVLFAKQADTMMLTGVDPAVLQPFGTAVTVPVTFGLRVGV
jgi:hypothetical protein